MKQEFLYRRNGVVRGPFSAGELRELAIGRKLLASDEVRRTDRNEWVSARSVKGLFDGVASADPNDLNQIKSEVRKPQQPRLAWVLFAMSLFLNFISSAFIIFLLRPKEPSPLQVPAQAAVAAPTALAQGEAQPKPVATDPNPRTAPARLQKVVPQPVDEIPRTDSRQSVPAPVPLPPVEVEYDKFKDRTYVRARIEISGESDVTVGNRIMRRGFGLLASTEGKPKAAAETRVQISSDGGGSIHGSDWTFLIESNGRTDRITVPGEWASPDLHVGYIPPQDLDRIASAERVEVQWYIYEGVLTEESVSNIRKFLAEFNW